MTPLSPTLHQMALQMGSAEWRRYANPTLRGEPIFEFAAREMSMVNQTSFGNDSLRRLIAFERAESWPSAAAMVLMATRIR